MGLRTQVQLAAKQALNAIGDLKDECVYTCVVPGVYDPATDTTFDTTQTFTFEAPLLNLADDEQDWTPIDRKTMKLLVSSLDLPVLPTTSDYVTIQSVRWEVRRVKRVPGDAIWIIFIQEP